MLFTSVAGVGLTLVASGVAQSTMVKKGKQDLADSLDAMTKIGALSYAVYFLYNLMHLATFTFL